MPGPSPMKYRKQSRPGFAPAGYIAAGWEV